MQGAIVIDSETAPNGNLHISLPFTTITLTESAGIVYGSAVLYNHGGTLPNGVSAYIGYGNTYFGLANITDAGIHDIVNASHVDTSFGIGVGFSFITA